MKIVNERNAYIKAAEAAISNHYKIYILGGGIGAHALYQYLRNELGEQFEVEAFIVNDSVYNPEKDIEYLGRPVIPYRNVDMDDPNSLIMVGYAHFFHYENDIPIPPTKGMFVAADWSCIFERSTESGRLDYSFYKEHENEFESLYTRLEDEKSRQILEAYINQKITGDFKYLLPYCELNQYFDEEIVMLGGVNCFVDCGAFTGDSFLSFIANYKQQTGEDFSGTGYLWEPNDENIKKIKANMTENGLKPVILPLGSSDDRKTLYFSGDTSNGIIGDAGDSSVEVDSIDNQIDGKIDFIKMDIEGSEYASIKGSERHIRNDHPILAICAYHKRSDLLEIPRIILSYYEGYKLYLRHYSKHTLELVIYAIPA